MTPKISLALLTVLLVVGFAPCGQSADVDELIWAIETPKPPAERPTGPLGGIGVRDWEKKRHEAWSRLRVKAREELTNAGGKAVQPLLELINRTQDDSVKIVALTALSLMGPGNLPPARAVMVTLLSDDNPAVRYLAAKTLGVMKSRQALSELYKLAKDDEETVRLITADALGQIGDSKSANVLVALLADDKKAVRLHAIGALGKLGFSPGVVRELINKLRSEDINECHASAEAIKGLVYYDLAADPQWHIARTAEKRKPIINKLESWWDKTLGRRTFHIPDSPELTLRVNMMLQKWQTKAVRLRAVERIREVSGTKAVDYLILAFPEKDKDIRKAVAAAATELSGISIKYRPTDTEAEWIDKIQDFTRRWKYRK